MKVTNWRRKLAATLVAGGLMSPAAAYAQSLNTNLVTNGDFEHVDTTVTGNYNGPKILDWITTGPTIFAYSHDGSSTSTGVVIDYANTFPPTPNTQFPASPGHWYFSSNNTGTGSAAPTDIHDPGVYYQDVNVSAPGAVATAIADGKGRADLSAYMTSYLNDTDVGHVRVDFRDNVGASLGFAQINDSDPGPANLWNLNSGSGPIPIGTTTMRVSLFGTRTAGGGGADGYLDNVEVKVAQTANPQFLVLTVNSADGHAAILNQTGVAIPIDYYEISSANGVLKSTWKSLQDQNDPDFPAGNGSGNGWEELGNVSTKLVGDQKLVGSNFVNPGDSIDLGFLMTVGGPAPDLKFRYAVVPQIAPNSDFNASGTSDGADFLIWQRNSGLTGAGAIKTTGNADGDTDVDAADLAVWKGEFGNDSYSTPGVFISGAVKYVPTGPIAAVPEPASVILVGLGVAALAQRRSRGAKQD